MIVLGDRPEETWPLLVTPDGRGPWALRYVWFKHERNSEFLAGYFDNGNELALNLRKLTSHLSELWKPHNDALRAAAAQGDIIWRVKVLNRENASIDHVEVWKSREVLHRYFHTDLDGTWTDEQRSQLGQGMREAGLIIKRVSEPYPLIGRSCALAAYRRFLQRAATADSCNIFTPLSKRVMLQSS